MIIDKIQERIKKDGHLYAPVEGMDYHNILHHRDIVKYVQGNTVLDIGAHWGYVSFQLERAGKQVYAVENGKENYEILKGLKEHYNSNIEIFNEDIFNFRPRKFDTVIALNIFHHFLRKKTAFEKFNTLLKSFEINEMILQIPAKRDFYIYNNAYKIMSARELVDYIISNTSLSSDRIIQYDKFKKPYFDRVIYMLNK